MSVTIKDDANRLSLLSTDVDNFRKLYQYTEVTDENEEFLIQFVAPKIISFDEYRFTLLKNSKYIDLKPRYYYRPDYISYNEYGNTTLWNLLLYINDIPSVMDFDVNKIYIPDKYTIGQISLDLYNKQLIEVIGNEESIENNVSQLYSGKKTIPIDTNNSVQTKNMFIDNDLYFQRDNYTVDTVIVNSKYVDLSYEPVINSISLLLDTSKNYIYDKHYTLIKGNNGYNRISWDPLNLISGIGMIDYIDEGMNLQIDYARKT